jgi:lipid-binding SYLF domain-containing protein
VLHFGLTLIEFLCISNHRNGKQLKPRERERTSLGVNVSIKGSTFGRENAFKSSLAETAVDFFLIRSKSLFSGRTRQTNGEKKDHFE